MCERVRSMKKSDGSVYSCGDKGRDRGVNFFMFYGCFFLLGVRWAKAIEKEVFFWFFFRG